MNKDYDDITLDDCVQLYENREGYIILSNGKIETVIYFTNRED